MLSVNLKSISDIKAAVSEKVRNERLRQNFTQEGLSLRSGVSLGSLKRFESSGEISLKSLIKIAFALNMQDSFDNLFAVKEKPASLDEIIKEKKIRKRGTVK